MATFRYKGDQPVDVAVLGRVVNPKDKVEVPDELVNTDGLADSGGLVWPEELWELMTPPKRVNAKVNKPAGDKDGE